MTPAAQVPNVAAMKAALADFAEYSEQTLELLAEQPIAQNLVHSYIEVSRAALERFEEAAGA